MRRKIRNSLLLLALATPTAWADRGLLDIWKLAVQQDAQLAQAKAQYEADRLQLKRARAALLPQVNLNATWADRESDLPNSGGDVRSRQISINAQQVLYNRKAWVAYDIAQQQVQQAALAWRQAQQDLMVRVVKAYFDVLLGQADVRLTRALEQANRLQWQRALTAEKVGLAANTDVLQARSAYDLSRADRIKAENGLNIAYENLAKLTGQRITALKSIGVDSALPPVQSNEAQWLQRALENNLQLKIAAYQVTQARLNVALNKGDYLPTLALTAALTDTAYEGYDRRYASTFTDNRNRQVALQLNWPIYSGGLTRATVEQARYQVNKALAAERDLRESTALQVRVLVDNLRNGMALVEALRAAVVSSQAFLQAAEESHRVGLKSMLDVLSARANAHKAQRDLIAALNDLVINRINLEAVAGDLNEADLARIESLLVAGDGPP